MTQSTHTATQEEFTEDHSPVDYRIAIGDYCNCSFRETVLESNSNSDSAIYYRKNQLLAIASELNIEYESPPSKKIIRYHIRRHLPSTQIKLGIHNPSRPEDIVDPQNALNPDILTDGGEITTLPKEFTKPFSLQELVELTELLGADVNAPYLEAQVRKFAGSAIAGPYLSKLISAANADPYISINVGSATAKHGTRSYYPFRLEPVHEIPKSATDHPHCFKYIVDSSIKNKEYDNTDVLDTALRVNSDAVILADVWHDVDATVDAIVDGLTLYHTHDYEGDVIIPLQPPHDECFKKLMDRGVSKTHTFALGGLKDTNSDAKKINAARSVRNIAPDIELHGLGFGITDKLASEIRDNPSLLDSIDYSTPAQNAIPNTTRGEERLSSVAAQAGAELIEHTRKISKLVSTSKSTTLTDF